MENIRTFRIAVTARSLVVLAIATALFAAFTHKLVPALANSAGTLIGLAYLFHIAAGFNRLVKGGKGYLPLLTIESVLRVLIAGAAPFVIVGHGPIIGYIAYLAGFVAPLAVAIVTFRQQMKSDSARTSAAS